MIKSYLLILFVLLPNSSFAHPGNTAADGCHYCRTNCDKWGEVWDERHCHGGYTAPTPSYSPPKPYVPPKPSCPANSALIGDTCVCKQGYASFQSSCIKIPTNAHESKSTTDAWECNTGYVESGNSCVPKPVPASSSKKSPSVSSSSQAISSSSSSLNVTLINQSAVAEVQIPSQHQKQSFWKRFWSIFFE